MQNDVKYVKANVTPECNTVLKIIAAEKRKYIYEVVEEMMREKYPSYFQKTRC